MSLPQGDNKQPSQEWLDARQEASAIIDRYLVSLRMSGNLVGQLKDASGPGGPYVDTINSLADLIMAGGRANP